MSLLTPGSSVPTLRVRRRRKFWNNLGLGLLFIAPWLIGFLMLTAYPFFSSLYFSFTRYNILSAPQWVGLQNYQNLVHDPKFLKSIGNTFYYTVIAVPLGVVLAIALALIYNQKMPGRPIFRTLMYVPLIVPPVATALLWQWIFNPQVGLLNAVLGFFGIQGPTWLGDPGWSKIALIIMAQWGVGGSVLLLLAALQDVPRQLYEAAEIDGASLWQKFWNVTLPMISPVVFFISITGIISAFQVFTEAFIVSGGEGGPVNSTLFYSLYLFQQAFRFFNMGYASAMAWLLFIAVLIVTLIVFRSSAKVVFYDRS
ncbi:sugar ABC transporter permease [Deinococcus sonorensis]|uniref:Sugar ABC transporter permease n=2 Tax=Deinococcus sonorensis TaxID=309891 RepID=A0AAU7U8M3_9DEIO